MSDIEKKIYQNKKISLENFFDMKFLITAGLEKTLDKIDLHVSINEAPHANVQEVLMIDISFFLLTYIYSIKIMISAPV